jgi:prepilin-type N-terminal cleavage/methylation domain-containing protein
MQRMAYMTITTRSPHRKGFTLVEVMVGATLSAFILAGILTAFLFIGRSGANLRNYTDMESQARKALEQFAEDTRQASSVGWTSATSLTLVVNSANVTWSYASGVLTRNAGTAQSMISGITNFTFQAYTINSAAITDFSTTTARTTANGQTKQIQISLEASRSSTTVTTATNIVLSARFVLRNKRVTA